MKVTVLNHTYDFKVADNDPAAKQKVLQQIAKSIKFEGQRLNDNELNEIFKIFRRSGLHL